MRVVVADATPLHYLILTDAVHILPRLFGKIYVPSEIRDELTREGAPTAVRMWMQQTPSWLEVLPNPMTAIADSSLAGLDAGERAAIALAEMIHADLLLIDDRAGAQIAQKKGMAVTGTLGLLDLGSQRGLVRLREVFARLQTTNFRYPPTLMEMLLEEERKRETTEPE